VEPTAIQSRFEGPEVDAIVSGMFLSGVILRIELQYTLFLSLVGAVCIWNPIFLFFELNL
jgi:hypothetical protein